MESSFSLFPYLKKYGVSIVFASLFTIVLGGLAAMITSLVGPALQILLSPTPETSLTIQELFGPRLGVGVSMLTGLETITAKDFLLLIPGVIVVLAAFKAAFSIAQWFMWERVGERLSLELRIDLLKKYLHLDPSFRHGRQETSDESLATLLSTDIRMIREYVVHFYGGVPREGFQVLFLTISLILLSPKMFSIFLLGVLPSLFVLGSVGKSLRRKARHALKDFSGTAEWIQQRLLGIETIKHYASEAYEIESMQKINSAMHQRYLKAARTKSKSSPILEFAATMAMILVLFFALQEIGAHDSTVAVQLSFFSTLAILSQNAGKLGRYFNSNREGRAAMDRYFSMATNLAAHAKAQLGLATVPSTTGLALKLHNVSVNYPGKHVAALKNFSFEFSSEKLYCICGPSGAGKSTLFSLVCGLIPPSEGSILVQTSKVSERMVGYLPQDGRLGQMSFEQSVLYPEETGEETKVKRALQCAGLEEVVDASANGLRTVVGASGRSFSGGQIQRLALARIYYHKRPIVLVDEATSALDPETEQLIFASLKELRKQGCLVIMIAHRYSAFSIADEVLLLDNGKLAACGSLEAMKKDTRLKQLFAM